MSNDLTLEQIEDATKTAEVRPDWKLPPAPTCPRCGQVGYPAVIHTGDAWIWGWECLDQCQPDEWEWETIEPDHPLYIDWPFVEGYAWGRDWEALGFEVL